MTKNRLLAGWIAILVSASSGLSAIDIYVGSGRDSDLFVEAGKTIRTDAVKTSLKNSAFAGKVLRVNSVTGFQPGDEILVARMQANDINNAGQFFRGWIASMDTNLNQMVLSNEIPYFLSASDRIAIQKVPHYRNVTVNGTLTADPWDGTTGGVIEFRVNGTLTVNATGRIDANQIGFRGGAGSEDSVPGSAGETYVVGQSRQSDSFFGAGGGGDYDPSDNRHGGGGGGGGFRSSGGNGASPSGIGGQPYLAGQVIGDDYISLGSGGGGGGWSNWGIFYASRVGMTGLTGGGLIHIVATEIDLYPGASISANGQNGYFGGYSGPPANPAGGGGGGSGGFIWLQSLYLDYLTSPPKVDGGVGSWDIEKYPGGNGGQGWYRLDYGFGNGSFGFPDIHKTVGRAVEVAPVPWGIAQVSAQVLDELMPLAISLAATNSSSQPIAARFSLVSGPQGMTVTTNGFLSWSPTKSQVGSTNLVQISATDGVAVATTTFVVVVRSTYFDPGLQMSTRGGEIYVSWFSMASEFTLESKDSILPNDIWLPVRVEPVVRLDRKYVKLTAFKDAGFFRLRSQ